MPELPEVEALAQELDTLLAARVVEHARLGAISALKTFDPPLEALVGRTVAGVGRRGKMVAIGTEPAADGELWAVVHLARGGWIRWRDEPAKTRVAPKRGPLALRLSFSGGGELDVTEAGTEKRLAVWVVHHPSEVPAVARLGPDPLDTAFDVGALAGALSHGGGHLKASLSDQSVVAGIGNAYSDEILHSARLSPFKAAGRLSDEELGRLHAAIKAVLRDAVSRSTGAGAANLKSEKRSAMRVHGRTGQECPVCGDTVHEVAFASRSLQYCPTCQTGGRVLADRRLSRLLK